MISSSEQERKDQRAQQQVEEALRQMEGWTENTIRRLRMTAPGAGGGRRSVAQGAARRGGYGVVPRHTDMQARVLRCMILLALATDPSLALRAGEAGAVLQPQLRLGVADQPGDRRGAADGDGI